MCGRFGAAPKEAIKADLDIDIPEEYVAREEIYPSENILAVIKSRAGFLKWGLNVDWASAPLINAKIETAFDKKTFSHAIARQRCLIPAAGWYEWKDKKKHWIQPADGKPVYFGGLWWNRGNEPDCVILTTEPPDDLKQIHPRMPLVIGREQLSDWLNIETLNERNEVLALLNKATDDNYQVTGE